MKKINNKIKAICLLIAIIIIAGIAVTAILGFNFDLRYQNTKKVELYLNKEFKVSEIKQITDEVLGNQPIVIQTVEVFDDTVSIISNNITDEQKANLITKINEKYQTELSADETEIVSVPNTRGRDIIKPYIMPLIIATALILVYMIVRYSKLGTIKTIVKTIAVLAITQAVLFSVIAIARIPIGRLTIPMVIIVYLLTLIVLTSKFEKELALKNLEQENK